MKRTNTFFCALLAVSLSLAAAPLPGADPALLALLPPDAKTLAGIQVSQAESAPIGQALMAQLQLDANANSAMLAAGFDPRRDLREVVAALGGGVTGGTTQSILAGRGSFRPDKIAAAAASVGAALSVYHGVQLIEAKPSPRGPGAASASPSATSSGALAFLDSTTMLAGDTASVKAAIDRHAAHTAFSGPFVERARLMGAVNDAWITTLTPPSGAPPATAAGAPIAGPLGNVLQAALQFSAGLKFAAAQVTFSADVLTRSPQDAQSMADVLKFAVQMMQPNRAPGSNASPVPSLADAARITAAGSTMHVTLSVPEQQLEQIFLGNSAAPARRAAVRQ